MKTIRLLLACVALATLHSQLPTALAQGTAFTYQGVLSQSGVAVNGSNDLTFTLYDAASGGNIISTSNTVNDLIMSNGLFTVTLDFGAGAFNGSPRWLQIAGRPGASTGAYTNLVPRQPITATPYAIYAGGASASGLTGPLPAAALSNAWKITGNAGTTPGTHFLGTTDNQPLELKVNSKRGLRLDSQSDFLNESINVIGGYSSNEVSAGVVGATIAGGGSVGVIGGNSPNQVSGDFGTVGGGVRNIAGDFATVGGGGNNTASGPSATVGGGNGNTASADSAMVPGGLNNTAGGLYSFAAGRRAKANHTGAFVWADSQNADFASTAFDQFNVRVFGGARFITGGAGVSVNGSQVLTGASATDGTGLTNLNASQLTSGTLPDARLSANVAVRNGGNFFGGNQIITNGNVSIGTTNPVANFYVRALQYGALPTALFEVQNCGAVCAQQNYQENIRLLNSNPNGQSGIGFLTSDSSTLNTVPNAWIGTGYGGAANDLKFSTQTGGVLTDRLFIHGGTGHVGINTLLPQGRFSVSTANGMVSIADDQFTPALVMTGGPAPGILRVRNSLEIWPNTAATSPGKIDVRGTNGAARIVLDGANGEITTVAVNVTSDRNAKEQFKPVNTREVLAKVAQLPISEWQYKQSGDARHIGPMAQDFHAAFSVGRDDKHITSVDADGVALAAIQGLNEKFDEQTREKDTRIRELEKTVAELKELVGKLAAPQNGGAR